MSAHSLLADVHQRRLGERLRIRRMLLNITTVECAIWRGWRVALVKHDNTHDDTRPHVAYLFTVTGDHYWRSKSWQVLSEPTRLSGKRTRERREAVLSATIAHLLTLPERAPDVCLRCGNVITRPGIRVQFCSERCQRQSTNRKCSAARSREG